MQSRKFNKEWAKKFSEKEKELKVFEDEDDDDDEDEEEEEEDEDTGYETELSELCEKLDGL